MLDMQGTGQFSEADRLDRMARDLDAIRETLGNTDYLFGPAPSAADAAVVPVLDMIRTLPCETELRALVRDDERIGAYLDRASATLYPS
jgi:glutathione S-transferase